MKTPDWSGHGKPPWEIERERLEALDLGRRTNWVGKRRVQYPNDTAYKDDLRRAAGSWDAIKGPDGKGADR